MTADTESMWKTLGGLALHAKNLPVAERSNLCLYINNLGLCVTVHHLYACIVYPLSVMLIID